MSVREADRPFRFTIQKDETNVVPFRGLLFAYQIVLDYVISALSELWNQLAFLWGYQGHLAIVPKLGYEPGTDHNG